MIEIMMTKDMIDSFNNNERIDIHDCEFIDIKITKDTNKLYNEIIDNKKYACYLLSPKDKKELNENNKCFLYSGKVKIYLIKEEGELQ